MEKTKKVEMYPLSCAQRIHFFTLKYCPKPQVLNIGMGLTILDDIDFDVLRRAIKEMYQRFEALRIRFHTNENGEVCQYIAESDDREIEYFNFEHWQEEHADKLMSQWTEVPFEREDSPMNRVVMISMPEGYKGIYLLVDHMTMDSHGIICMMKDMIEIYCHYKYGVDYPGPIPSYLECLKKDLAYESSGKAKKDKEFWEEYITSSEPIFSGITGSTRLDLTRAQANNPELRAAKSFSNSVDAKISRFILEKEPSDELLQFCADNKVPMVCLLMMGLRTYLSKVNNRQKDVSIISTVSRRATILEKSCGGTRVHYFPCRTILEEDVTFLDGIKAIQDVQNTMFRHANHDPASVLGLRAMHFQNPPGASYEALSLTYQPASFQEADPHFKDIRYKTQWYSNGVAAQPLYLTVMHNPTSKGMDFYFEYQSGHVTPEELEYMYYYLCRILFMGIRHKDSTIGDILALV